MIAHSGCNTAIMDQEGTSRVNRHEDLDIAGNLHRLPEGVGDRLELKSTFETVRVDPWSSGKSLHYVGLTKMTTPREVI